jgi:tetratricopeptide (TPR) repeat protein
LKQALIIYEKVLGPEDPELATWLNNMATLYHSQGKYKQAEPLYQRALAIAENNLGPEHPSTKTFRENYQALVRDIEQKGKGH